MILRRYFFTSNLNESVIDLLTLIEMILHLKCIKVKYWQGQPCTFLAAASIFTSANLQRVKLKLVTAVTTANWNDTNTKFLVWADSYHAIAVGVAGSWSSDCGGHGGFTAMSPVYGSNRRWKITLTVSFNFHNKCDLSRLSGPVLSLTKYGSVISISRITTTTKVRNANWVGEIL